MRILVTGANGYVGRAVVRRLLAVPALEDSTLCLLDADTGTSWHDPRISFVKGDISDPEVRRAALDPGVDILIHLAGMLGGAAEADYDRAKAVNVDATLALFEALRNRMKPPRIVFASSIAVFGPSLLAPVDDDTPTLPTMTYGAQKLMMEAALGTFSRRGELDGLALRLPGIVARPDADARLKSAFLNRLFHDYAAGREIVMPVSPGGQTWLLSRQACADNVVHAALLARGVIGQQRSMTLPAICVSIEELIAALRTRFPDSKAYIRFHPDAAIEAQFAAFPPLRTPLADRLGFRADADLEALIEGAMDEETDNEDHGLCV